MHLLEYISQNSHVQDWQSQLNKSDRSLLLGLSSSSKACVMASAYDEQDFLFIVTASQNEAENLSNDLSSLLGEEEIYTFTADDNPLAEFIFSSSWKCPRT